MDDKGETQNENLRTQVPLGRQNPEDDKPQLEVCRSATNPIYIKTQVSEIYDCRCEIWFSM